MLSLCAVMLASVGCCCAGTVGVVLVCSVVFCVTSRFIVIVSAIRCCVAISVCLVW